jgi:hypothetical protein
MVSYSKLIVGIAAVLAVLFNPAVVDAKTEKITIISNRACETEIKDPDRRRPREGEGVAGICVPKSECEGTPGMTAERSSRSCHPFGTDKVGSYVYSKIEGKDRESDNKRTCCHGTPSRTNNMALLSGGYARGGWQTERWLPVVEKYFNHEDVLWAMEVIDCASAGDDKLDVAAARTEGLFQHASRYFPERAAAAGHRGESAFDADANVAAASYLFYARHGGAAHWACNDSVSDEAKSDSATAKAYPRGKDIVVEDKPWWHL